MSKDFKLVGLNSSALVFKSTFAAKVFLLELDFEVLDNFESLLLITICIYLSVSLRFTSFTLSWSFGYHNITKRLARLKWEKIIDETINHVTSSFNLKTNLGNVRILFQFVDCCKKISWIRGKRTHITSVT